MPRLGKSKPVRQEKNKVLIVCGGHTEKCYFDKIKEVSLYTIESITVKKVSNNMTSPLDVVNEAIQNCDGFNFVYAVFDRDNFKDYDSAFELARKNNIIPIYSNQSFELWLLYHWRYFCGCMNTSNLISMVENHIACDKKVLKKGYKKSDISNIWCILEPNISFAMQNSKTSEQHFNKLNNDKVPGYETPSKRESSTNIYQLMERIYNLKY